MSIMGKQIYLRAMEPEDMEMCRDMINDEEVSRMVVGWSFPVSKKEQMDWYNRVVGDRNKRFTICMKDTDQPVGIVTLTDIDLVNRSAFHGIGEWFLYNTASKRLYEKCGWYEEGIKKKAIYRNGEYHDLAICGILKEEYLEAKKRLGY